VVAEKDKKSKSVKEGLVATEEQELAVLKSSVLGLQKNGQEVNDLLERIGVLSVVLKNAQNNSQKENVFNRAMNEIAKGKKELRGEIAKWQTKKADTDAAGLEAKEREIERQTAEDAKRLEAEARKNNDLEFSKLKNNYLGAEKELSEFFAYALKHNIKINKSDEVKIEADLKELGKIFKQIEENDYKDKKPEEVIAEFKQKHNEFDDFLERLYPATEEKPAEPQPVDAEKEKKEQDKRDKAYEDAMANLKSLKYIITNRGKDKSALKPLSKDFRDAEESLRKADDVNITPEEFVEHLLNFEGAVAEILSKVHPSFKKAYESQKEPKARVVKPEKPPEPKKPEPVAKVKKEEVPPVAVEPVPIEVAPGVSEKEWKERKRLHSKLEKKYLQLKTIIEEQVNNKPSLYFIKELNQLRQCLENAKHTDDVKVFEDNTRDFNEKFDILTARAEQVVKATKSGAEELVKDDSVPGIPEETAVQSATPEAPKISTPTLEKPNETLTSPEKPVEQKQSEVSKSSERKRRILDIPEKDLLEIVGEKKLHEVVSEIILGNADAAKVLMKDIFSRKDIDLKKMNGVFEKFGYTPVQFMKEWADTLHVRAFEVAKQWVEQMSRNWLNQNIKSWDKIKENPVAQAKLWAVNILPFAVLAGSVGALVVTAGASHVARGAVVGGASGLLRGLKAKVGSVKGWFEKRKEKANKEIEEGILIIEEKKAAPLRDSLLAQFSGENGPDMMEQLSAMLSQSLRDASAAGIQKEAIEKLKSGAAVAIEEISAKIDAEFEAMKKSAGEETAVEVQRSQAERAETLIKTLYEDQKLEELINKVIERDPKIVSKLKGLKIKGIEFGKLINEKDKDPIKEESDARKVAAILASVVAGASVGAVVSVVPEMRAVLGAVAGGYMGAKWGHIKDEKARREQFAEEFKNNISGAEKIIEEWEKRQAQDPSLEPTSKNIKELAERAKDLRAPLNLQMLEGDINLKLRAQNALRRLESLQINLYIYQNPGVEQRAIPEAQRNRGVERLLVGLNSELEEMIKHQQNIEKRILQKPGWWRTMKYAAMGAAAGAVAGYGAAKASEYLRGDHEQVLHPTAEEGAQHPQISHGEGKTPVEDSSALEHPPAIEPREVPVLTEPEVRADHTVAVEVLNNKEGILSGVNKIIHNHPDVFTHPDGKAWTANEIHLWKVHELKEMGFKFEGGKWGHPMTVHGGAEVEVYTDENGQPHFKLASEEHVTFNKNYKWAETKPADTASVEEPTRIEKENLKIVDTGAVSGRKGDYLINPFPEDSGVTHAPTGVDADIRDKAVVHHAPKETAVAQPAKATDVVSTESKSVLEASAVKGAKVVVDKAPVEAVVYADQPVSKFLSEHNSNPEDFVETFELMRHEATQHLDNSLILSPETHRFLDAKLNYFCELQVNYKTALLPNTISDNALLQQIEKVLNAESFYKLHRTDWMEDFGKALLSKNDKVMQLAFAPARDTLIEPIFTNGGHAARIWDPIEQKDVFIYDKGRVYNTSDDGRLIVEDEYGVKKLYNSKEALQMSAAE